MLNDLFLDSMFVVVEFSEESNEAFEGWSRHDASQNNFCELDGE